jgi:hypothetical protein
MGVEHDDYGFIITFPENGFESVDYELHWRMVAVQDQDDGFFGRFDPLAPLVFPLFDAGAVIGLPFSDAKLCDFPDPKCALRRASARCVATAVGI